MTNDLKSKRGSYIAEAAIVMPFIVIAVIASIMLVMYYYSDVCEQCHKHIDDRTSYNEEAVKFVREINLLKGSSNDQ